MSAEHQQHLRRQLWRLEHRILCFLACCVSMNGWNYTEYILVVPHYLTNNYE